MASLITPLAKGQKIINVEGTTGSSGWIATFIKEGGDPGKLCCCCEPTKPYPPKINGAHVYLSEGGKVDYTNYISPMCDRGTCNNPNNKDWYNFANSPSINPMYVYRNVLGGPSGMHQQAVNSSMKWGNVSGSGGAKPPSPYAGWTWIHWYALCNQNAMDGSVVKNAKTGKQAPFPPSLCYGCGKEFLFHAVGAHVGILDMKSSTPKLSSTTCFIVPMCSPCNTGSKKILTLQIPMGAMATGDHIKLDKDGKCVAV